MSEATVAEDRGHPLLRRFVLGVILVASGVALYVAFALHEDSADLPLRPAAIRVVSPEPGTLEVRQTTVFYELDSRYAGTLRVDSVVIPDDQIDVIQGLNRVSFTPGEDKEFEEFSPGAHNATAVFWPVGEGPESAQRYTWRFNVH
jgi:hypothetical protein